MLRALYSTADMPAAAQLKKLSHALKDFYAPGLDARTFVGRTFELTSRLVPFDLNSYGAINHGTGALSANFDSHPAGLEESFAAFGRLMGKYPAFRFDPSLNKGRPFSVRDFYSAASFRNMDIHREVYRPMGFVDHCFAHIPSDRDTTVFVGFLRGGSPFDSEEKKWIEMLQPHLANGRQLALAVSATQGISTAPEIFARLGFTPREGDVIHWLTEGKSNEEIATLLHIRADSVSRHLHSIYEKMGVEHRIAAACHALTLARQAQDQPVMAGGVPLVTATR